VFILLGRQVSHTSDFYNTGNQGLQHTKMRCEIIATAQ